MGCTCFSSDKTVKCDHQADTELLIELEDNPNELRIEIDDTEKALAEPTRPTDPHLAAGQAKSRFYEHQYNTARAQDRLWEQLRQLHRTVRPRPHGQRQTIDFGDSVPKELRYLVY